MTLWEHLQVRYGSIVSEPVSPRGQTSSSPDGNHVDLFVFPVPILNGDGSHSVYSAVNEAGHVVERVQYDVFGRPDFQNPDGKSLDRKKSIMDNPYLFQGRRWDAESKLYYYRNRYYDPGKGRFVTRDPMGLWLDQISYGNGYNGLALNPKSFFDSYGLQNENIKADCKEKVSVGVGIYMGLGWEADISYTKTTEDCCNKEDGIKIYKINLSGRVGVGIGGKFKIPWIGRISFAMTGPGFSMDAIQITKEVNTCEGEKVQNCYQVCSNPVELDPELTVSIGPVSVEADIEGGLRVCVQFGPGCPEKVGFGFEGDISIGGSVHVG